MIEQIIKYQDNEYYLIVNFPGYYISRNGGIYSIKSNKLIKKHYNFKGWYEYVTLRKNNKTHYMSLHRLVALQFILNSEDKLEVNHKDFNKSNNCVENLEWCTHLENMQHVYKYGNKKPGKQKIAFTVQEKKQLNKLRVEKFYKTKPEVAKQHQSKYNKKRCKLLTDSYCTHLLRYKYSLEYIKNNPILLEETRKRVLYKRNKKNLLK